uniref:Uncharacterized protein n=1 Tax=Rhodnius prolixus TaxID=13249 RepID=T1I2Q3_RHOPR
MPAGFKGARVDGYFLFHCNNTLHSIDFWMGIDTTSVVGNTCKDNCTKVARKDRKFVQAVNKKGSFSRRCTKYLLPPFT